MNRAQRKRRRVRRRAHGEADLAGDVDTPTDRAGAGSGLEWPEGAQPGSGPEDLSDLESQIDELREKLAFALGSYDAFDLIANLWVVNSPFDPDTYRESTQEGLMSVSDYVGLLLSERPSREPTREAGGPIDAPVLDGIDGLVKVILGLTDMQMTARARQAEDRFEEVRAQLLSRRMFVQGPGFDFQETALIEELLAAPETEAELKSKIGFSARDGLAISEAIVEVGLRAFLQRKDEISGVVALIQENDAPPGLGDAIESIARRLGTGSKEERRSARKEIELALSFASLGTTFQVRAEELAGQTGIAICRIEAYLRAFSITFGQNPGSTSALGLDRIRRRPLLADGEGNYILVSHLALFWALRPALEGALKNGPRWHRYERARSALVERSALRYLSAALPGARAYEDVSYSLAKNGEKVEYEIDGLVILDTVMFVVEGKSSPLGSASRRGAPLRLRSQLEEILVKAANQAERARQALKERGVSFRTRDGGVIEIPEQVSEIFPIVVTLENFSELTTMIWELEETGLLPEETPTPWALSLYELELICDLTEYPAMLIHFLRRRARLNELRRVRASDELDWWMHYLEQGLFFEEDLEAEPDLDGIFLLSQTDALDAYYLWRRGHRTKKAKKPRQRLPGALRSLLDALRDSALPGHVEASVALLEFNGQGRREFPRSFKRIRETTRADGEFHDLSITISGRASLGITCLTAPGSDRGELEQRLAFLVRVKKHQTRLRRWVGLGWCAETPQAIDVLLLGIGEWQEDETLDGILEEIGFAPSAPLSEANHGSPMPRALRRRRAPAPEPN